MRNLIKLILFAIAGLIFLLIIYIFLLASGLEIYLLSPIAAIYIPHYPNAQYFTIDSTPRRNIYDTSHTDISFTTKDGKSKVEEYYTTELSKKGWSLSLNNYPKDELTFTRYGRYELIPFWKIHIQVGPNSYKVNITVY